jgi:hypothetical protein
MNSSPQFARSKSAIGFSFATLLMAIALLLNPQFAKADVVSIWVNDGVNGWKEIATDPTGVLALVGSYKTLNGAFLLTNSSAAMTDSSSLAEVNSTSFHVAHIGLSTDTFQMAVIGNGFTSPSNAPINVKSQISGTNLQGVLIGATFQSYVDPTNNADPAKLAGGQGLQTPTVFPTIGGSGASQNTVIGANLATPYSVAHLFTITMAGDGQIVSLGGDTVLTATTAVPEPGSVTLICMCATGLGGYGLRRRRQQQQAAASKAEMGASA